MQLPWTAGMTGVFVLAMGLMPASAHPPAHAPAGSEAGTCARRPVRLVGEPSSLDFAVLATLPDSATLLAVWASRPEDPPTL